MIFKSASASSVEYIIAGLGNPGKEYENTRHNAGFITIDHLARRNGITFGKTRWNAITATGNIDGHSVLLLKPQTYMNESGVSVAAAMRFYKLPPEKLLILLDDVNLDVGVLRIRQKGSDGGQRGMRSIIAHCGTNEIPRIKMGVGKRPTPEYDMADWVLSKFSKTELSGLMDAADNAADAVPLLLGGNIEQALNKFSR